MGDTTEASVGLVREFLKRKGYTRTLSALDTAQVRRRSTASGLRVSLLSQPKTSGSYSSSSALVKDLKLVKHYKANKSRGEPGWS